MMLARYHIPESYQEEIESLEDNARGFILLAEAMNAHMRLRNQNSTTSLTPDQYVRQLERMLKAIKELEAVSGEINGISSEQAES